VKRDWEENSGEVRPQVIEKDEEKGGIYLQVIEQTGKFLIRSEFRKS
jgi:L-2-hydroxyglutarate oxidase LhgO